MKVMIPTVVPNSFYRLILLGRAGRQFSVPLVFVAARKQDVRTPKSSRNTRPSSRSPATAPPRLRTDGRRAVAAVSAPTVRHHPRAESLLR